MMPLRFASDTPRVLCLGAHSDDIEIGCAGTLLEWTRLYPGIEICWVVLSTAGERATEARKSVRSLLGAAVKRIELGSFPDGHLPAHFSQAKAFLANVRDAFPADVVLTHRMEDRHQDHRLIGEMAWQTWRDQLILEYEIPKYEGDLGQPNVYMPLSAKSARRKVSHLMKHFGSQRSKSWFTEPVFEGLMQIRGVECRAASGYAEAFHARKVVLHGQD